MTVLKTVGAAAALSVLATGAFAADIPALVPVPEIIPAPKAVAVGGGGGWYLRGDVGVSASTTADWSNEFLARQTHGKFLDTNIDEGLFVGVGAGYKFSKHFRADVTAEFRGSIGLNAVDKYTYDCSGHTGFADCAGGGPVDRSNFYRGDLRSYVVMANAYADLGTYGRLTPFIGVGLGGAYHSVSGFHDVDPSILGGGGYTAGDHAEWDLAYAAHLGLAFQATDSLALEVGYRYLNMGSAMSDEFIVANPVQGARFAGHELDDLVSHDVRVGMRWHFGGDKGVSTHYPDVAYSPIPYKH